MTYEHGRTICISSQVGCRMGCRFCASTIGGKVRDLVPGELLGQVIAAQRDLGERISNIVMMGIGEPLDNYDNVVKFLRLVSHPDGLNIGLRHISLSTCGVVPNILRLADREYAHHAVDFPARAGRRVRAPPSCPSTGAGGWTSFSAPAEPTTGTRGGVFRLSTRLIAGRNDSVAAARQLADVLNRHLRTRTESMPIHVRPDPRERGGGRPALPAPGTRLSPPLPWTPGSARHPRHGAAAAGRGHQRLLRTAPPCGRRRGAGRNRRRTALRPTDGGARLHAVVIVDLYCIRPPLDLSHRRRRQLRLDLSAGWRRAGCSSHASTSSRATLSCSYTFSVQDSELVDSAGNPVYDLVITQTLGRKISVVARVSLRDIRHLTVLSRSDFRKCRKKKYHSLTLFRYDSDPFAPLAAYLPVPDEHALLAIPPDAALLDLLHRMGVDYKCRRGTRGIRRKRRMRRMRRMRWGNFLKEVSPHPFKNFQTEMRGDTVLSAL